MGNKTNGGLRDEHQGGNNTYLVDLGGTIKSRTGETRQHLCCLCGVGAKGGAHNGDIRVAKTSGQTSLSTQRHYDLPAPGGRANTATPRCLHPPCRPAPCGNKGGFKIGRIWQTSVAVCPEFWPTFAEFGQVLSRFGKASPKFAESRPKFARSRPMLDYTRRISVNFGPGSKNDGPKSSEFRGRSRRSLARFRRSLGLPDQRNM